MMENSGLQLARLDKHTLDFLFTPDSILTLAAPKTELIQSGIESGIVKFSYTSSTYDQENS